MIRPKKQCKRNCWEVAFVVTNITIRAEVEGSRALRKTRFPPLSSFYSSLEFSHLTADETEKFSFLCAKNRTTTIIYLLFTQRKSQMTWIRREVSMPFPTWHMRELQWAPGSQRGPLSVPGWVPSHLHIPCRDVTTQHLRAHPPVRGVGSPRHSPLLWAGCRHLSHVLGEAPAALRYLRGGLRGQGVWTEHGVTAWEKTCSNCPKSQKILGLTTVHFLTKKAAV